MSRFTGFKLGLTFVLAVVALMFALWPVVTEAPWEDGITEAELHQILEVETQKILEVATQITQDEKEAGRTEACEQIGRFVIASADQRLGELERLELFKRVLDNGCFF